MERELTLTLVSHPRYIDEWSRVDHPVARPVQVGEPTLGWEGDPRLVIYFHPIAKVNVLWRFENDGEYRPVAKLEGRLSPQSINRLCARLVEIDQRRGFDPYVDVTVRQEAAERASTSRRIDMSRDFSDKLLFALSRTHLPGVDVAKRVFPLGG